MIKKLIRTCITQRSTFFHGNLKDTDRIFTNLYGEGDFGLKGAEKRVNHLNFRATGTKPKISSVWAKTGSSMKSKNPDLEVEVELGSPQDLNTHSCLKITLMDVHLT